MDDIINLDTTKLQTEATGQKIVKDIQEWLLTRSSSQETAVLPDDKVQRLLVGVCTFFFLKIHNLSPTIVPISSNVTYYYIFLGLQPT